MSSFNTLLTYTIDIALAAVLLAGFFGAAPAATAVNAALALYVVGFTRAVLS
jgi:hypothetical protein